MLATQKMRFAQLALNKRIEKMADELELTGLKREVFVYIAQGCGEVGFVSLSRKFDDIGLVALAMAEMMKDQLLFMSGDRYYTIAIR